MTVNVESLIVQKKWVGFAFVRSKKRIITSYKTSPFVFIVEVVNFDQSQRTESVGCDKSTKFRGAVIL